MPELSNYRRELFCRFYMATGGNQTRAAKLAGYAPKSAHVQGHRAIMDDKVKARLDELKAADYDVREITPELIKKGFLKEALSADHPRDRKAAWDSLARCEAMFTDNTSTTDARSVKDILAALRGHLPEEALASLAQRFGVDLEAQEPSQPTHEGSGSVN